MKKLCLPTRYETLQKTAEAENMDITRIVVPIDAANNHIMGLFSRIEQTRVSRFEVLYGASGCGKTCPSGKRVKSLAAGWL